jgi:hypothetical protein
MSCIAKIVGWANGLPCEAAGQYIKSVDVQLAPLTDQWLTTTRNINKARTWETPGDFMKTYHEVLKSDPVREDGKPNRPLTALTIVVHRLTFNDS